ncbi:MAG TPA: cupin domain-containing protein [Terriglobales bacterium]
MQNDATVRVVNIAEKLDQFTEHYSPKIVGEVNDCHIKLVKFKGDFVWHHHENEDEMFLVISGVMKMRVRDAQDERELTVRPGEFVILPRGVEHMPGATEEVAVLLVEPRSTLNTGNVRNERTHDELERL